MKASFNVEIDMPNCPWELPTPTEIQQAIEYRIYDDYSRESIANMEVKVSLNPLISNELEGLPQADFKDHEQYAHEQDKQERIYDILIKEGLIQ